MSATASLPTRPCHRATTAITAAHAAPNMFAMDAMLSRPVAQFKMPRLDAYTANAQGQPYIQHRGGPAGFLKVLDERTIGFADFAGNRQYITQGNLEENPKAHLFLIDYANRRRIKIWGTARVVESDEVLLKQLMPAGYRAKPEQVMLFTVTAWDVNCPQHIPQRMEAADVRRAIEARDLRIATLEAEVKRLRQD